MFMDKDYLVFFSAEVTKKYSRTTAHVFFPFASMAIDAPSSVDDHQFCQVRAVPSHMIQEQHSLPTCMTTRSSWQCVKP
jgi:hypothetical protein